ncbi:MAG TPA: radical SAM protein [Chitinivibrionales bacterium]|nr:radical SAM protein [Chitinivibrionales bacterium]
MPESAYNISRKNGGALTLTSECHCVRVPHKPDQWLLYFPLKSLFFKVNKTAAEVIGRLKAGRNGFSPKERSFISLLKGAGLVNGAGDKTPYTGLQVSKPAPYRTQLLLTHDCSLACLYCYSGAIRSRSRMSFAHARAAVDLVIRNALAAHQRSIDIGFHGGGEPTANWKVLTKTVEYARRRCAEVKLGCSFSLCTNMLLPVVKADWIARNIGSVTISIDGTPAIQNRQRPTRSGGPSYTVVARAIDRLTRLKKPYGFRVTVTGISENKIEAIYRHLTTRFRPNSICFEPLFVCGKRPTESCRRPGAGAFINGIKAVSRLAQKQRIGIQYSGGRLAYMGNAFCGAAGDNFFITPQGDVTSCLEVSSRRDKRSRLFFYGSFNAKKKSFDFNLAKYRRLKSLRMERFEPCSACFARWHCAGDCLAKKPDFDNITKLANDYRCGINRELTLHQLLRQLDFKERSVQRRHCGEKK